jgi:hypothetical protein
MRSIAVLLITGFFLVTTAEIPEYGEPFYLWDQNGPICAEYYGSPSVADWDGDGLKDLFLGEFMYGRVHFYPNQGTNDSPVFTFSTYMMMDETIITVPYG